MFWAPTNQYMKFQHHIRLNTENNRNLLNNINSDLELLSEWFEQIKYL